MQENKLKKDIIPIFPSVIGEYNLDENITKKALGSILNLELKPNTGNFTSIEGYALDNIQELEQVRNFCLAAATDFFQEIYRPDNNVELYITQSWINYNKKGEYHHRHAHPNSIISGSFYFQCSPDDKIIFMKDRLYPRLEIIPTENTIFNSKSWWFPCSVGKLYLWDASIEHAVDANLSENVRISLSFNTFVCGKIGSYERQSELILKRE